MVLPMRKGCPILLATDEKEGITLKIGGIIVGIIGTILGMIMMMSTLDDVAQVPRRMALCLSAAFMGLGSGYLIFLPMAGKLKRRSESELLIKEIIIRGILLLPQ